MELKLKLGERASVTAPTPTMTKVETVVETPVVVPSVTAPTGFRQKVAAYWNILPGKKKGDIFATSDRGDRFEGSAAEFKRLMRT